MKFDHIKYLLADYAINLKSQLEYGKAYEEPRIVDRGKLLEASIRDANTRLAKKLKYSNKEIDPRLAGSSIDDFALRNQEKLFIIEDTSVRIDALSSDREFPGVDVKYWMKEVSFIDLDQQLMRFDNNRKVSVRSDIVIYLPPSFRTSKDESFFKVFTGITQGSIVDKEFVFDTNPVYPWLDNKTFNKWFIPKGEKKPISLLSIEKSQMYDFRKKAIDQMVAYLQKMALTNLKRPDISRPPFQTQLFDVPSLIICGATCAGKTVLARHLADKYGYYHIEASDFMHLAFYRKHGYRSSVSIHKFALNALQENPSIVSEQIHNHLELIGGIPVIITGFRSAEELKIFQQSAREFCNLFIEASVGVRFNRSLVRARTGYAKSLSEFKKQDRIQLAMGIMDIRKSEDFNVIKNEATMDQYFSSVDKKYIVGLRAEGICLDCHSIPNGATLSLEESIIISLYTESNVSEKFFTTNEIAQLINTKLAQYRKRSGNDIITDKNNVSRYFNQHLHPYYEANSQSRVTRFRLSITGESHAKHMLKQIIAR